MRSAQYVFLAVLATAAEAQIPADVRLTQVVTGFNSPVALRNAADGSNRMFMAQQGGLIRVLSAQNQILATPFLTVNASTTCQWNGVTVTPGFTTGGERGLLGLAFHPSYSANGRFFVNFTDGAGDTVVARFNVSGVPNVADAASCVILVRVDQDFSNHNGGNVLFGPDNLLYVGMGDGGSGGDPCSRGQTLRVEDLNPGSNCAVDTAFVNAGGNASSLMLLGKMLRLNVDATTPAGHSLCGVPSAFTAQYAAPAANVFGPVNKCPETFAYGLRNPWRFSFDRQNGDLVIGDVGQNAFEEITYQQRETGGLRAGVNHGWRCFEGEAVFDGSGLCSGIPLNQTHDPVYTYGGAPGSRSVTGGYIYRGPVDSLRGFYIFADQISSAIYFLRMNNLTAPGAPQPNWPADITTGIELGLASNPANTATFGEDEQGNLYIVGYSNGLLARFTGNTGQIFRNGFELAPAVKASR